MLRYILPLFLASSVQAGQIAITGLYKGLNDTDPAITLADGEAQSLLNVEVSLDGNSIVKRSGYALLDTMAVAPTTGPVHGSILFRDSQGSNIEVYANDVAVYKSSNSGAYTQFITTATVGAKWSFCEAAGIIYAFNDKNDVPFSYDGATVVRYNNSSIVPWASICAMTPTRMLLAGTTDQPNRLYFSEVGDYDNFTLGTDPDDPSFDDIGMAGDKITGLWANAGEWLIWKTNSMISYQGTNQYDLVGSVISGKVGLSDPQARLEHNGVVYFRGTDAKIWAYAGGILTDTTRKLETFISNATKDLPKNREYTTKALWDLGTFVNTASTITSGAIEPWLVGFEDTTDADFDAGTASSVTVLDNKITINNFAEGTFPNMGLEMGTTVNWSYGGNASTTSTGVGVCASTYAVYNSSDMGAATTYSYLGFYNSAGDVIKELWLGLLGYATCGQMGSVGLGGLSDNPIRVGFSGRVTQDVRPNAETIVKSTLFLRPTQLNFYTRDATIDGKLRTTFDMADVPLTSGTFTSRSFNTGNTAQKYCEVVSTRTLPGSTYALQYIQTSSNSTNWALRVNTSDYLSNSTTNQYVRYQIDFQDTTSYLKPSVESFGINCLATGTWTSDEYYAGSFTNWGLFKATATLTGNATWTYQISTGAVAGGTGSNWYTIQTSSAIGIPVSPYVKLRAISSFFSSTDTIRLNQMSYSYNITTAHLAQGFEYLGNIYFTVPSSGSVTNNRTMKLDLNAGGWTIFDIAMNAPLISGNNVHFGSPTTGKIYTYPSGGSDEGTAINSYWKSKDYMGDNVYVTRNFDKLSLFMDSDYSSDVDVTYSLEPSTSTTYNMTLTQTDGSLYIRNNRQLPTGTNGSIFNLKIANNAVSKPWRFYGSIVDYSNNGWVAYP